MTQRAAQQIPVDWQVEAQQGTSAGAVLAKVRTQHGVQLALPVRFAPTSGLQATVGGATQQTGPGKRARSPRRLRLGVPRSAPSPCGPRDRRAALPADGRQPPRPTRRHRRGRPRPRPREQVEGRRRSSTCRPSTRSSRRSARLSARSRRRRRTTSCCCLSARWIGSSAAASRSRRRSTRASRTRCRPARARPTPRSRASARNLETRLAGGGLVGDNLGTALDSRPPGRAVRGAAVPLPWRPGRDPRRLGHRVDRGGRRGPAPARRRAAAHPRRVDPPPGRPRAGRDRPGGRPRRGPGPRRRAGHRRILVRHRELRRLNTLGRAVGRRCGGGGRGHRRRRDRPAGLA